MHEQAKEVKEESKTWPNWMRRAAGLDKIEDSIDESNANLPPDVPISESSARIQQAAQYLKSMTLRERFDLMESTEIWTAEEVKQARVRLGLDCP